MLLGQIIEEKFPLGNFPKLVALVSVETNHVGRDDIEPAAQIGQGLTRFDPPDHPLDAEQVDHFCKARFLVEVHPENVVPEKFADVEEVAGAAADIEHALAPAEIESEVAHTLQVNLH